MGKDGKENTDENKGQNNISGDNDGTDGETTQNEQADLEERDERTTEVEAEVRREMGIKSMNGKQEEADDEIETLSDMNNGEMEGEEVEKSGEEAYHLHNGLDEQEPSANEVQDENSIDVKDVDSADQE